MISQIVVIIGVLLVTMFIGTPVAFSLAFTGVIAILSFMSPVHFTQFANIFFNQFTNINQMAIPLFVLMAELLARGRIATDIYGVLNKWFRNIRGGLAISATLASTIFAALCGSSPATAASIGRISINEMIDKGYRGDFATGVVAAGGTLGIMIPPSITLITYGIITETSIVKLFMAGLLPGLLLSALLCTFIVIRLKLNPDLCTPMNNGEFRGQAASSEAPTRYDELKQDMKAALPAIVLIIVVLGSMYTGVATATEAAAIGCLGSFILVLLKRRFNLSLFIDTLTSTMKTSTMIMFLVACGLSMSYTLSYLRLPQALCEMIIGTGLHKWVIMILIYILWYLLGALMDPGSMVVLTVPFIFPTLTALGFDPIWIGIVSTLCVEIGMITPPVGLNLFVLRSVSDVPLKDIIKGAVPFVIIMTVALIILSAFPQISLFLPSRM